LIEIGSKTAEKLCANKQTNKQTDRQTNRHYENNGHLAVPTHRLSPILTIIFQGNLGWLVGQWLSTSTKFTGEPQGRGL